MEAALGIICSGLLAHSCAGSMKGMQGYPQQNYPQRYHEVIDQYGGPLRVWAKAVGASILVHFAVDKDRSTCACFLGTCHPSLYACISYACTEFSITTVPYQGPPLHFCVFFAGQTLILLAGILCCGALHEATKLSNQRRKGMLVSVALCVVTQTFTCIC